MVMGRELDVLARRGRTRAGKLARLWALFARKTTVQAYQALFLTEDGELTHKGALVIQDLARVAGLGKVKPDATPAELQYREGKRAVLLHLLAQLEPQAIERLAKQIREAKNDRSDDTD